MSLSPSVPHGIGRAAAGQDTPPVGAALHPCPWGRERRYGQMQRIYIFGSREEK
ncbi:hypothetical protein [Sporosarcina sp. 179-K 8C2 HS]|uniref:hypothetical protein n=1 Tax=Sporosarcina sp. 179-K 8C2 HS TaxID=3142387 RepID=UPI0039A20F5F